MPEIARRVGAVSIALTVMVGLVVGAGTPVRADTVQVFMRDNYFDPQRIHIAPGDTVTWTAQGFRTHTATSDTDLFDSGDVPPGGSFSYTFRKEGFYYYHCMHHGQPRIGMWGVVVVGHPTVEKSPKQVLVVPDDFKRIQAAVDHARPGATVVIRPGRYHESVAVTTPHLTIRGVDRFRSVLDGQDLLETGLTVTAGRVTIENLTVRNFTGTGIAVSSLSTFLVRSVDLIKDRTDGLLMSDAYNGVARGVFAWGSGEAGLRVDNCFTCSILIDRVTARRNAMGYLGSNATGVVVRGSTFAQNGAGVVVAAFPDGDAGAQSTLVFGNAIRANNVETTPGAGLLLQYGIPYGTGAWSWGADNVVVQDNRISRHDRYGVLVSQGIAEDIVPTGDEVRSNAVAGSGRSDLAWDGTGSDDCFQDNQAGSSAPSGLQSRYSCDVRPFPGQVYQPVLDDVHTSVFTPPPRTEMEPPQPHRPRCQRGRPGCK